MKTVFKILIGFAGVIVVFSITSLLIVRNMYDRNFGRAEPQKYTAYFRYGDVTGYERTQVDFMSGVSFLMTAPEVITARVKAPKCCPSQHSTLMPPCLT